jgi:alpha-1,3-mannosyltransferase
MIGGIENYVLSLAREQQKDNEVSILTLNRSFVDGKILPATDKVESINIYRIPYSGSHRYPIALSAVKYLKNYDILHVHCIDFFIDYIALTKPFHGKKIILTTHGGFFHTKKFGLLKKVFFHCITRCTIKFCYRVIACSESDYSIITKISSNVTRIDNGVNITPYINTEKKIKPGTFVYVGRIDVHKRIDNLIKVVKALNDNGAPVILHIIGPDWNRQRSELEKFARQLNIPNNIVFDGVISDRELVKSYQEAQLFLSASEYEGFGISAIEALSSGTLCVVHHNDNFKNLFNNKNFAVLTDFSNTDETASRIIALLHDGTYAELSAQAREFAKQYSWDITGKKITQSYQ